MEHKATEKLHLKHQLVITEAFPIIFWTFPENRDIDRHQLILEAWNKLFL